MPFIPTTQLIQGNGIGAILPLLLLVTFIQKILKEVTCPRCNAIAQERLEDRDDGFAIIYLSCPKCYLKRNLGITTRRALKLKKRQKKLRESLSQARNQRTRSSLQARITRLEEEIRRAEMGIT